MDISGLNNMTWLPSIMNTGSVSNAAQTAAAAAGTGSATAFGDILQQAISDTVESDAQSKLAGIGLVTGQEMDLHSIPIAAEKAELLLNLTVQIRNKMIESYQEVMRMQV